MYFNLDSKQICHLLGWESTDLPGDFYANSNFKQMVKDFVRQKTPGELIIGFCMAGFLGIMYLLAIVGLVVLFRERQWELLIISLMIIAYFSALTGVVGIARYKLPIVPFYSILSAQGGLFFLRGIANFSFTRSSCV